MFGERTKQKVSIKQKIPRLNVGKFQLQEPRVRSCKQSEFKRKDKPAILCRARVKMSTPDQAFYHQYHYYDQIWAIFFTLRVTTCILIQLISTIARLDSRARPTTHTDISDTLYWRRMLVPVFLPSLSGD